MPQAVAKAIRDFEEANDHVVDCIHAFVNFGEEILPALARVKNTRRIARQGDVGPSRAV
jgi:hypothetical protein